IKMATTVEDVIHQVGDCGKYQFLLVPLVFSSVPPVVWSMLMMVFGALEPDWWCESRDLYTPSRGNGSVGDIGWVATTTDEEVLSDETPGVWNDTWGRGATENGPLLRNCSLKKHGCDRITFSSGANTLVSEFQLVCDLAWVPSMMISVQMVGVLVGASVSGQLGDSVGRKKTLVSMTVLHTLFTLVAAFSNSWQMFTVLRALIGFTVGGVLATSFTYPTEFIGIKWRPLLGTLPVWGIGAVTYSLVVWALRDWRHVHIATAVCTAATLPAWIFLPESIRWLSVKGHVDEAHHVLRSVARWNRRKDPDVGVIRNLSSRSDDSHKTFTYFHICSNWNIAKIAIVTGCSCSLTYYGISFGIKSLSGDFYLNFFLMAVVEVPPSLFVYYLANRLGRRWTCGLAFFVTSSSCLAVIPAFFFAPAESVGTIVNGLSMVARMSLNLGWNTMTVFVAELYPTVVRNIGIGYCNTTARIGGILAPYILSS
ncbi:hypothetical protein BaRGS_00011955, partial [Batillaria attramentaria]